MATPSTANDGKEAVFAWRAEVQLRAVHSVSSRQAEVQLRGLQPVPARQGEEEAPGLQAGAVHHPRHLRTRQVV